MVLGHNFSWLCVLWSVASNIAKVMADWHTLGQHLLAHCNRYIILYAIVHIHSFASLTS